ncbi:MAG TPA: O-antigen ligase family protein [Azospirillum sp.]|nr:O-antigen ligase family protein [Azospirillum sp.]
MTRRDGSPSVNATLPATVLAALAGMSAALLGPLIGTAPRGMPVWLIVTALVAAAALAHTGRLAALRPGRFGLAAVGGFVVLAAASVAWSPSGRALATTLEIAYVATGALLAGSWIATLSEADAGRLARLFVGGLVLGIAAFTVEDALGYPVHQWINGKATGYAIDDSNVPKRTAVLFALLVWPGALALHRAGLRTAALALPALYAASSVLQSSRSAMVGVVVGLAAFALARASAMWFRRALAALLVVAFTGALPLALFLDRGLGLADASWLFTSARHRVEIWSLAANRALESPLLGQGIDSSRALKIAGEFRRFAVEDATLLPLHPHNAFLQVWLETGAAGAMLALALALLTLGGTRRLPADEQPYALALFAAALVMVSTAYGIWQAWWMAGIVASGLMLRLAARAPRRGAA